MIQQLPSFDVLKDLYEKNPKEFEKLRSEILEDFLANEVSEKNQKRMRGLQFQIDAKRRVAKTPMGSCLMMSQMMHDSFVELRDLLNEFNARSGAKKASDISVPPKLYRNSKHNTGVSAAIIPFKAREYC